MVLFARLPLLRNITLVCLALMGWDNQSAAGLRREEERECYLSMVRQSAEEFFSLSAGRPGRGREGMIYIDELLSLSLFNLSDVNAGKLMSLL